MRRLRLVALVLVILVLGTYGVAQGASVSKTVKAFYRNIAVVVNGKAAPAAEEQPFIVDGRVYVPLRYVAQLVGAQVNWDNVNNRVLIATAPAAPASDPAKEQAKWQEGYNAGLVQGQLMASKSAYDKGYKEGYDTATTRATTRVTTRAIRKVRTSGAARMRRTRVTTTATTEAWSTVRGRRSITTTRAKRAWTGRKHWMTTSELTRTTKMM